MAANRPNDHNLSNNVTARNLGGGTQPLHSGHGPQIFNHQGGTIQYFAGSHDGAFKEQGQAASIVEWLNLLASPFDTSHVHQTHQRLQQSRVAQVGMWALDHDKFQDWKTENGPSDTHRSLWLHGIFGSGKTMLVSLIIDHLTKRVREAANNKACIFLYFSNEDVQPTITQIWACLTSQLLGHLIDRNQDAHVVAELCHIQEKHQASGMRNNIPDVDWPERFRALSQEFEQIYIIFDALDNYARSPQTQTSLLKSIRALPSHVKLLITTRSNSSVANQLREIVDHDIVVRAHRGDVEEYVRSRIKDDENLQRLVQQGQNEEADFESKVIAYVRRGSKEIFLVAVLHLNGLSKQPSIGEFKAALTRPPEDLPQVFESAVQRIKGRLESDRAFASHVFTWLIYAARPMSVAEILHSFSITKASQASDRQFDRREEDLTLVCEDLIVVEPRTKVARMVHDSVQHLLQKAGLLLPNPTEMMLKQCLKYLVSDDFSKAASCQKDIQGRCRKFAFLEYAANSWKAVLEQGSPECTAEIEGQAMELLVHKEKVASWFQIVQIPAKPTSVTLARITGLHATVFFDAVAWAERLIDKGVDINATCSQGQTALHWAARQGLASSVKLLLDRSARLDITDAQENTPLHMVFMSHGLIDESNYGSVITQLVARDASQMNVRNKTTSGGFTPFERAMKDAPHWTAQVLAKHQPVKDVFGTEDDWSPLRQAMTFVRPQQKTEIVRSLLRRGADVQQPGSFTWHPLIAACQEGNEDVVWLLLKYGAPTDVEACKGDSPLQAAITYGHARVAQLLIDHGADVQHMNQDGSTPLIEAVKRHQSTIAWLLLDKNARTDDQDSSGSTALHHAILNRNTSIVWLLATRKTNALLRDEKGLSALDLAALSGDASVSWILLHRDNQLKDKRSQSEGSTALFHAAGGGYQPVVQLLLSTGIEVDAVDDKGFSALVHALIRKHRDMVQYLLAEKASVNIRDRTGAAALHHAIRAGSDIETIRMLLEAGANQRIQAGGGITALMLAAKSGMEEEVRLLLQFRAYPCLQDAEGRMAEDIAKKCGYSTIVAVLAPHSRYV